MATLGILATSVGTALSELLLADDIEPGSDPSYGLCKTIYNYHPLGKKLADSPVTMAQSQPREISVAAGPERVRQAFVDQWTADGCDGHIFNVGSLSRQYGIASIAMLAKRRADGQQIPASEAIDYEELADLEIAFNVLDPLNTAGSLVGDLNPNSMGFLKTSDISVSGRNYHRSRSVVKINEKPIYLAYTTSAFGYVGRSVYQRALYPLKSYVKTMITNDMVATKAGVIVAKMKPAGSIVSNLMQSMFGQKRDIVKEAATWNVISISPEEGIESLDLHSVNTSMAESRKNILNDIAAAADMPAIIINSETYVAGFGEGTEDAKNVARYIEGVREEFRHIYDWFDQIVMHRAWNKEFYLTIQEEFPNEYGSVGYREAFQTWRRSFKTSWPSLIQEPESEAVKVADTKLKAIISLLQVLLPEMDPENQAEVIRWAQDNFNEIETLFTVPLDIDFEALESYTPPEAEGGEAEVGATALGSESFADARRGIGRLRSIARSAA